MKIQNIHFDDAFNLENFSESFHPRNYCFCSRCKYNGFCAILCDIFVKEYDKINTMLDELFLSKRLKWLGVAKFKEFIRTEMSIFHYYVEIDDTAKHERATKT